MRQGGKARDRNEGKTPVTTQHTGVRSWSKGNGHKGFGDGN